MNKELNEFKSEFINYLFEKIKKLQKRNEELNDILDNLTESEE